MNREVNIYETESGWTVVGDGEVLAKLDTAEEAYAIVIAAGSAFFALRGASVDVEITIRWCVCTPQGEQELASLKRAIELEVSQGTEAPDDREWN